MGTGKTWLLKTCRRPILIHSFDPGGTKTLRKEIDEGWIIADTRFEKEDPKNPTAIVKWDKEYDELKRSGFFNHMGTYSIDSATTWAQSIMYEILKKDGRPGGTPYENNWLPQMTVIENAMRDFTTLPCDCILTCHLDVQKDQVRGKVMATPMLTGKLRIRVPALFDEVYVMMAKETSGDVKYSLLTRNDGLFEARSRLGLDGIFSMYEEPDIKALLRKAGLPADDKPIPGKEVRSE
jgi:hypothetical protein